MLVRDLIPGATEAVIFPLQQAPAGVQTYNKLLDTVDAQNRCRDSKLRGDVLDRIGAGDIIIMPARAVFILRDRLEKQRLDGRQIVVPSLARTLGYTDFWPAIKELIVLVAPHPTAWSNAQEAWLGPAIDAILSHWLPYAKRRINGQF